MNVNIAVFRCLFSVCIGWLFFAQAAAQPERLVEVGLQPLTIIPHGDVVHVFCNQVDRNFDGIRDTNDTPASWWTVDAADYSIVRQRAFEWGGIGFPFRPGFDASSGTVYLPHLGRIRGFDANTQELVNDTALALRGAAVHYDSIGERIAVSHRPNEFGELGKVVTPYQASVGVGQTLSFATRGGNTGFVILNEGNFGASDSKLLVYSKELDTQINLGNTGNHLYLQGDSLIVTMNGSHEVHIIDMNTFEIVQTLSTGTEGFDGPRESIFSGNDIFTTTYNGDLRRISLQTGKVENIAPSKGKAEGLAFDGKRFWVANAFEPGSFTSANSVAVFSAPTGIDPDTVLTVGPQPVAIIILGEQAHIFCNQVDVNFNGIQDEGDSPASWWIVNTVDYAYVGQTEFPWGINGFPFRPAVDEQNYELYVPMREKIALYDMTKQELIDAEILPIEASAVSYNSTLGRLLVSIRPADFSRPGEVWAVYKAGVNVAQCEYYSTRSGARGLLILNEGIFGSDNSSLQIIDDFRSVEIELGDTGNHLFVQGDSAYITVNGSHAVRIVDLNQQRVVRSIETGTEGFNGPREAVVADNELFVATYNNDVLRIDLTNGEIVERFVPGGRPEGIAMIGDKLWVTNAYLSGSFNSDNTVAVWDTRTPLTVDATKRQPESIVIAPHPVRDNARIRVVMQKPFTGNVHITVRTMLGDIAISLDDIQVAGQSIFETDIAAGALAGGLYVLHIVTSHSKITQPFLVLE